MRERLLLASLVAGCVFPVSEPTGVELSWRFFEANQVDGEDATRVRSCGGLEVDRVAVDIVDDDSPWRDGIFRFPCETGYQTALQFQTEASDAFVQLNAGVYRMAVYALDDGAVGELPGELLAEREVDVDDRGITVEPWELSRTAVNWQVSVTGAVDCTEIALALYYDDTESQLPELENDPDEDADEDDGPLLYRKNLESDRGLTFDGSALECGEDLEGTHLIDTVDRGLYLLEVTVDGTACAIRLDLTPETEPLMLDLAALPCGG